ncbi:GNAT family N-acetyltransferase [Acetobacterium fimetarium]|nr:GNAT family N-acetyltransferase [Acetobacterium fimetarium]
MMERIHCGTNKFYIGADEDDPIAVIIFHPEGDKEIIIEHVYVSRELREQGIGKLLVDKMADYARSEHKTIRSFCSYAEEVLAENTEYEDVYKRT